MKKIIIGIASIFVILSGFLLVPADFAYAQDAGGGVNTASVVGNQGGIEASLEGCNLMNNFSLCVLSFIYNIILYASFFIVGIAANILDFFLGYTLNSNSYRAEFVEKGWALIRDISNVAFIFTLLYLAIRHILGLGSKKYIPTLIMVALLLNFSLFFTKVVIDGGNILGRAFYESISTPDDNYADESGYKGITSALVSKINPQQLLSQALFAPKLTTNTFSTSTGTTAPPTTQNSLKDNFGWYALVFLVLAGVNFTMAFIFISVALLFVGRTIGLWFSMIFSPIAFITLAVPESGGMVKQLSFDTWKDQTLKLAFVAPIFIFFLYLTIMFLNVIFSTPVPLESRDTFMIFMSVLIPFIFVIVLLRTAKKVAEDMSGEMGGMVKSAVGKLAGGIGGLAIGTAAFAGRKVIGGIASSALKSGDYNSKIAEAREKLKKSSDPTQRMLLQKELYSLQGTKKRLTNWKKSSFDIRNSGKSTMLGGAVGGAARFADKNIIKPTLTGFAGDKMNFGKGSDQSRDKFEKEQTKKKLEMAEDQSSVSFRERGKVVEKRRQEDLFALLDMKKEITEGLDNETKAITSRLDELLNKGVLNKDEMDERIKLEDRINVGIPKERKAKLQNVDNEAKKIREKKDEDFIKDEEKIRRGFVADAVDSRNLWGALMGVDNKEIAHSIRSGKTSKTDAEKFAELAKKLSKDDEEKPKASTGGGTGGAGGGGTTT